MMSENKDKIKILITGTTHEASIWRGLLNFSLNGYNIIRPNRTKDEEGNWFVLNQQAVDACLVHIHCISSGDDNYLAIAELMQSLIVNPKGTILIVKTNDNNKSLTKQEFDQLMIISSMVNSRGGVVILNDLAYIAQVIKELNIDDVYRNRVDVQNKQVKVAVNVLRDLRPNLVLNDKPDVYSIVNALNYLLGDNHNDEKSRIT